MRSRLFELIEFRDACMCYSINTSSSQSIRRMLLLYDSVFTNLHSFIRVNARAVL